MLPLSLTRCIQPMTLLIAILELLGRLIARQSSLNVRHGTIANIQACRSTLPLLPKQHGESGTREA